MYFRHQNSILTMTCFIVSNKLHAVKHQHSLLKLKLSETQTLSLLKYNTVICINIWMEKTLF